MNVLFDNDIILLTSNSEKDTYKLGETLGLLLKEGSVVAITGPLGAGKTHLVKGIAKGLGIKDSRIVTSPTFTLVNEYLGRVPIYHIDVYRLTGINEMYDLGCDEMLWGKGVTIIEWADRVKGCLPDNIIKITILYETRSKRRIEISSSGMENEDILGQFKKMVLGFRDLGIIV